MNKQDLNELAQAKKLLEKSAFVTRLTDLAGKPLEMALNNLPTGWKNKIHEVTQKAIQKALEVAVSTIPFEQGEVPANNLAHRVLVAATGAGGGALGLGALPIELPISTALMLRSILDIARSEGMDLSDPQTRLACLEVFAFGGFHNGKDASDSGYFAVRAALGKVIGEAATYVARKGLIDSGAPALAKLVIRIASRFEMVVAQKMAAQMVPLIGAIGGASLNVLFMNHFQDMARGHFIVMKLEKRYGTDEVKKQFNEIQL